MKTLIANFVALVATLALVALTSASQTSAGANASGELKSGTPLQAELNKTLDAKSAKVGDEVSARLTQDVKVDGKIVLRKGSKLVGRVTQAQAHTKEHPESQLGILFDHALLKGGEQISFNGVIRRLAPPAQPSTSLAADENTGMSAPAPMGGGPPVRTSPGADMPGRTASSPPAGSAGGASSRDSANGSLPSAGQGASGLQGLTLNASAGAQGSVISSTSQTVKLESGTQMTLQVSGPAQ